MTGERERKGEKRESGVAVCLSAGYSLHQGWRKAVEFGQNSPLFLLCGHKAIMWFLGQITFGIVKYGTYSDRGTTLITNGP